MSKSNAFENDLMQFTFNNVSVGGVGTTLYLALHTGDPGEAGDQLTNECAYTSYARIPIARSGSGFTVAGNTAQNAVECLFPTCTGGSETATHLSIGVNASGASKILYKGALSSTLAISNNIAPRFAINAITVTED
jgi:hypothetical protein